MGTQDVPLTRDTSFHTAYYVLVLISAWVAFKVLQALYNVSPLHPLSHIPGPRIAAATYLLEFYYDVVKFGCYTKEIKKMHEQYGPIVRINPNEVHCSDISFADEIYAVGGRKRDKPLHQINGSALGQAGFGTVDHDIHRLRRVPLAKFFSRAMIARLEPEVHGLVQKLCDKLLAQSGDNEAFDIAMAYSCFTSDAISSYSFGESFGFLDQKGWYPNFRAPTASILRPVFIFRFFPWTKASAGLGKVFVDYVPKDIALLIRTLQIDLPAKVIKAKADIDAGITYDRPTIFASLLQSELELSDKETHRLADEAAAVVGAGTETTSWALSVMTYHLLTKPDILAKLTRELKAVVEDPKQLPAWPVLETLPYLGAVIQEGLRLSYGVSSRTARIPTEENLLYRGEWNKKPVEHVIPQGYAVGMSAFITHHDHRAFPDSYAFIPERWLDEDGHRRKDVERSMLAFSKGSRSCLGMNLALCELHLCLTALVLRVIPQMRLSDTTDEDLAYDHDMFIPMTKENRGVRVIIAWRTFNSGPWTSYTEIACPQLPVSSSTAMSTTVNPNERIIPLDGLPLAILAISCVFWVLSVITVSMRAYTRISKAIFGLDDAFMVAGTIVYTAATGLAIYALLVGLGRLEADLNAWQRSEAMKYYIIWILTYVLALAVVKSSIWITILRIASTKINLRVTVYVLLGITWASFCITFIGTLLYCRPVRTIWTPLLVLTGKGSCAPVGTFVIIGHVATVSTIVTDLALVVVPAIILWNTQMKKQQKLQAFGLLSFASVASIITMVRIPYINRFEGMTNLQFWVAHIMLCSNVETGIGCVASSVPSLRHFFRGETSGGSSGPSNKRSTPGPSRDFFTIGSQPRLTPADGGFSLSTVRHGREENWEPLHDGASDQSDTPIDPKGLYKKQTYAVDIEMKHLDEERQARGR
ncbi:cytochrome P450 [Cucurbitaria berberidis CBS 394.84]|uniref:Cytochrome P450 n=1 Tax=Cucurbitaria berberidis CBS 394.84 TaxID=1168544 RepID=A0A9P4GQ40_9PLEO|nr:cytochrome P450 [Cucurbitaria berberidis CBS 394.84]KAF1849264.1 cytochrome P450 [Cucurbitaria berberidis CBS 394.84]